MLGNGCGSEKGMSISLSQCRVLLGIGRDGASVRDIIRGANALGINCRAVRLDLRDLRQLPAPAILHWRLSHFLVLERVFEKSAVVVDPAEGRRRVDMCELDQSFTGVAIVFDERAMDRVSYVSRCSKKLFTACRNVKSLVATSRSVIIALVAYSIILQLFLLTPALVTKVVVDDVIGLGVVELVPAILIAAAAFILFSAIASLLRLSMLGVLKAKIDEASMSRFVDHLLALPFNFFLLRSSSDLLLRLGSNVVIRDLLTTNVLAVVFDAAFLSVYVVILIFTQYEYALAVLILAGLQCAIATLAVSPLRERAKADISAQSFVHAIGSELLQGIESVKAMGLESEVRKRWWAAIQTQLAAGFARSKTEMWVEVSLALVKSASPLVLLIMGMNSVLSNSSELGSVLALSALSGAALGPVTTIVGSLHQLQTARVHFGRIDDVMSSPKESSGSVLSAADAMSGNISLDAVSTRYSENGPWVLKGISFRVESGQKIAIVGPTGSGKTSLGRVILGLQLADTGTVSVGGITLEHWNLQAFRGTCGHVSQQELLISGSIGENIRMGRDQYSRDDLIDACSKAQLYGEIQAMPLGFDTPLGEGGAGLSGGQAQRLALSRALLGRPQILLLDEATSHLDLETERRVEAALDQMRCTRIVISHRLSSVVNADRIIVLDGGCIVQEGVHSDLVNTRGVYRSIFRS